METLWEEYPLCRDTCRSLSNELAELTMFHVKPPQARR